MSSTPAPALEPRDPEFRARVQASFMRQCAMAMLRIALRTGSPRRPQTRHAARRPPTRSLRLTP